MERISKQDETRIVDALKTAIERANGGLSPSTAIGKVASENGFSPEIAKRMVEGFNTSKTLHHLKTAEAGKAEAFQLADFGEVLNHMYPEAVPTTGT